MSSKDLQTESRWRLALLVLVAKRIFCLATGCAGLIVWLWCVGFVYSLDDNLPRWVARSLAILIGIGFPVLLFWRRPIRVLVPIIALAVLFVCLLVTLRLMEPRHDRSWGAAQARLPTAEFLPEVDQDAERILIKNIRSFRDGPIDPDHARFYDDTYDLSKLKSVWYGVDRFTDVKPLAHTFLSFEFEEGTHRTNYLAFSVETRREKDEESYSPIRGIFNNYELIYIVADEQDVLVEEPNEREHVVQLYPVRGTRKQVRLMFLDVLQRMNRIRDEPEFYHTFTNNCTNNIVFHTNRVLENPINRWQRGVVLPGYSDWLAYRLEIIDTELSLEQAQQEFRIDQRVKAYDGRSDFSEFIRGR